jgi:predicted transcriptional regulator
MGNEMKGYIYARAHGRTGARARAHTDTHTGKEHLKEKLFQPMHINIKS